MCGRFGYDGIYAVQPLSIRAAENHTISLLGPTMAATPSRTIVTDPRHIQDQDGEIIGYLKADLTAVYTPRIYVDPVTGAESIVVGWAGTGVKGGIASASAGFDLSAADESKQYTCTTALTVSVPDGLSPRPSTVVIPPASGNLTITPTGSATLNGAGSSLTRTFTNNRQGVLISPNPYVTTDYSVSGS
jgi:hypothetical protein